MVHFSRWQQALQILCLGVMAFCAACALWRLPQALAHQNFRDVACVISCLALATLTGVVAVCLQPHTVRSSCS